MNLALKKEYRVMPLGDSITGGYCKNEFGGYRFFLTSLIEENGYAEYFDFVGKYSYGEGYDNDHNGTNGACISAKRENAPSMMEDVVENHIIETYKPDIILLQIGSNDINHQDEGEGLEFDNLNERLEVLVENILLRMGKENVLFLASIPYMGKENSIRNEDVDEYNAYIELLVKLKSAEGYEIYFVDVNHVIGENDLEDHVHPNREGYEKIGQLWYSVLINYCTEK